MPLKAIRNNTMTEINIENLDKADVLVALYNNARQQGLGLLNKNGQQQMTKVDATELLRSQKYFDYVNGRVLKVNLATNTLETALYNRDNGENAAEIALRHLL